MQLWQFWLLCALGALILLLLIWRAYAKWQARLERDFTRRLETVLQPKETIRIVCPGREGHWVLTSKRLLMEEGDGFFAVPFTKLRKLQGQDKTGKATAAPAKMAQLTVNGTYTFHGRGKTFPEFAKELKAQVKKQTDKIKAREAAKCQKAKKEGF